MSENIKELLNEEIAAEIQAISSLNSGSEEKSKAIEDLAKLYRLRIEETKSELDAEDKRSRRTLEKMCIRDRSRGVAGCQGYGHIRKMVVKS